MLKTSLNLRCSRISSEILFICFFENLSLLQISSDILAPTLSCPLNLILSDSL